MTYNADKTWDDLSAQISSGAADTIANLYSGEALYQEWLSFAAGRTNAQIATDLQRTEEDVAAMNAAYSALKEIFDFADNIANPVQADRFYSLRKFS